MSKAFAAKAKYTHSCPSLITIAANPLRGQERRPLRDQETHLRDQESLPLKDQETQLRDLGTIHTGQGTIHIGQETIHGETPQAGNKENTGQRGQRGQRGQP